MRLRGQVPPRFRRVAAGLAAGVLGATGFLGAGTALLATPAAADTPAGAQAGARAAVVPAPVVRDGGTSVRAAASCWEIIQGFPGRPSGVYWLQTPQLVAPQQFWCDMTTDGGGWVLVGRGRQGWSWTHNGQGQASAVRTTATGPAAFAPAALPAATIDGLLGGARVDALSDGIRVVRAKDAAGATWQELRLRTTNRANWSWSFGGGLLVSQVVADGVPYAGGSTQSWTTSNNQQYLRITTTDQAVHNYQRGFAYGTQIAGANDATSYLWQYSTEKMAIPFSQIFVRPKLTSPTYPAIAPAGTAATTVRALMGNLTQATPWGVTGVVGGGTGELNMEVEDIAFVGRRAFVGGKFQYVQKGRTPAAGEKVEQSYLAAFDVSTGEWIPTFRPVLNGMVWSLAVTPGGKLVVGGEFTSVNGEANTQSLASIDPITGAVDATWHAPVAASATTTNVRGLDVQGGWLYVGGRFTSIAGGGSSLGASMTLSDAARVSLVDGRPDPTWKPHFDGTIYELDASSRGDRVYYVGVFANVNFTPSANEAAVSTEPGAPLITGLNAWLPSIGSGTKTYQQTILENGNDVWQGGSQHILTRYSRDTYAAENSSITRNGGDFQALAEVDGVIYGSCHCIHYAYSGTTNYGTPVPNAQDVNNIRFMGAWDAATGAYLPEFYVAGLEGRQDQGPWALRKDPDGCLWFGGDLIQGSYKGSSYQWLGAFGKLCPRDTTAPTAPASLTASVATGGTAVSLSWGAAADASAVSYEILRDDRVVATTTGRTWTDTEPRLPSTYWVRAVDAGGNRSASTAGALLEAPDVTPPTVAVTSPAAGAPVYGPVPVTVDAADDRAVTRVDLLVDGVVVGSSTQAPFTITWTSSSAGGHTLAARARDAAGNTTDSAPVVVTVPADSIAPSAVGGLVVTGTTSTTVTLGWDAATDDRAVAGYTVSRDGVALPGLVTGTSLTDVGRLPGTTYGYSVHAVDAAGNAGPESAAVSATTPADTAVVAADAFTGADGSAWAAPWATSVASGSATVTAGAGDLTVQDVAGAYARAQLGTTTATSVADGELLLSYHWNQTGPSAYLNVWVRGSGGWQNGYRPKTGYGLQLSSSSGTASVMRNVAGTLTTLRTVTGAQVVGTGKQWLRLRTVGTTVQFRIWPDGTTEPATWADTETDGGVTTAGQVFVSVNRGTSNVGIKTVSLDDVTLRRLG